VLSFGFVFVCLLSYVLEPFVVGLCEKKLLKTKTVWKYYISCIQRAALPVATMKVELASQ